MIQKRPGSLHGDENNSYKDSSMYLLGNCSSLKFMTFITVDSVCDLVTSVQFILTLSRFSFTGWIDNMDITGKLFLLEILE